MLDKLFRLNQQRLFVIFYAWLLALALHFVGYVFFYGPYGASENSIFYLFGIYFIPAYLVVSLAYTALHMVSHWHNHNKHLHDA